MTQRRREPINFKLPQMLVLCDYLKANYKEHSDSEFAKQASEALGFEINEAHIYNYRTKLGIKAGRIAKGERLKEELRKSPKAQNTRKLFESYLKLLARVEHLELRVDTYFNTKKEKS
jgi:hypothetical protein